MKGILAIILCLAVATTVAAVSQETINQFIEFQHTYNRFYPTPEEFNYRLNVFSTNLKLAANLQSKSNFTTYGITKFMDLSTAEFKSTILMKPGYAHSSGQFYERVNYNTTAPSSFDWRSRAGVLTPVYNQGQCGSCWAFSATENVESQWALKGHGLHSLSMQQIVSCDKQDGGCNGGNIEQAFNYVKANGLEEYSKYPYVAKNAPCTYDSRSVIAHINGYTTVTTTKNEAEMVNSLVANGPLSVAVDASQWQFYKNGVLMASNCGHSIDHAVLATGYDTAANPPYWTIRNSWGADWGLSGYIHIQYGKDTCAVAQDVTFSHAT